MLDYGNGVSCKKLSVQKGGLQKVKANCKGENYVYENQKRFL